MHHTQLERDKRYRQTWPGKFAQAKARAKRRGIEWKLTYEQFFRIWKESGKMHLRGNKPGQYQMGRAGDAGAYEDGNVAIIPATQNWRESMLNHKPYLKSPRTKKGVKRTHTRRSTAVTFED